MKSLEELKNKLQQFKFGQAKKTQKNQNTKASTLITKSFSNDEDLFMFI
ncbi:hypothetical protein [uncultured Winogradskyella sp.]|nr:hypothetical protein [uncultured Winogradskyella sp.]|tara:strand:- start:2966 stop:3112 length:147 start_codon:yes stop_codon:yes gene_type:complete